MITLLPGDCRDVLPTLPADSVQCVVCSPPYYALRSYLDAEHPDKHREIGSEPTPDAYLATMVAVFREVRRVLRPDGTCWVNMGDSYASGEVGRHDHKQAAGICGGDAAAGRVAIGNGMGAREQRSLSTGLPAKNLLLMPARLALALQADGWWVRSDIIIAKRNPMPESVRDRPVNAHEHVFLLTKSARYHFDADAIREPQSEDTHSRGTKWRGGDMPKIAEPGNGIKNNRSFQAAMADLPADVGRSCRNVWDISTEAFGGAHFATMPTSVVERCIRAGTSERGCCAVCGKPWGRVTDTSYRNPGNRTTNGPRSIERGGIESAGYAVRLERDTVTTGWQPGCKCEAGDPVPCTVLDCFAGAGTTLLVADRLQRDAIGIELNVQYTEMAMERCRADAPLFTSFPPAEPPDDERMADLFADAEYHQLPPRKLHVPAGWDTGPGAHGTIHRNGRTMPEAAV